MARRRRIRSASRDEVAASITPIQFPVPLLELMLMLEYPIGVDPLWVLVEKGSIDFQGLLVERA
jgi:hypothetical protein